MAIWRNSLYFSLLAGNSAEKSFAGLPPPPCSLKRREIRPDSSGNCKKWAQFRDFYSQTGLEKVTRQSLLASFAALFSKGHSSSPRDIHQCLIWGDQTVLILFWSASQYLRVWKGTMESVRVSFRLQFATRRDDDADVYVGYCPALKLYKGRLSRNPRKPLSVR
jgi:hypothetical protein